MRKEYIRPSKLPQTAPVFFVGKKDGKKRMVQDYQYLNKWTVKNNYSLPLIYLGYNQKYWYQEGVHKDGSEVRI